MKKILLKEIFYVLTGALVIFSVMELFWDRIVLAYINISWVLILWLLIAIFILLQKYEINE
jgi:hypothetical protein